jgi:hypothetical protein
VDQAEDRAEDREDHYASLECLEMNREGYRARPGLYLEREIDLYRELPSVEAERANGCASANASGNEVSVEVCAECRL